MGGADRGRPRRRPHAAVGERGKTIGRAAATGLPECGERFRHAAPAAEQRTGRGRGDPRPAPPDHRAERQPGKKARSTAVTTCSATAILVAALSPARQTTRNSQQRPPFP
ncbi:hypothetical protein GCM10010405_43060 [Streptomyces macrosporus]|uniref:Uncharacterized protein n=1 Tax=Streptomyces macrosporus TaxID=44032 RepID=A0ABN3KBB9_9ACTN